MGSGVIPSIRVRDMAGALEFYTERLGFAIKRGGAADPNCAISRGDARVMLEVARDLYGDAYNAAIRDRLGAGSASATALYIEASDIEVLYAQVTAAGVEIVDPLGDRPWGQSEFTVADPEGQWLSFWRSSGDG